MFSIVFERALCIRKPHTVVLTLILQNSKILILTILFFFLERNLFLRKKSFFEHVELEFSLGTIKSLGKPGYIHELSSKV